MENQTRVLFLWKERAHISKPLLSTNKQNISSNGEFVEKYEESRSVEELVKFMKSKQEPQGWVPTSFDSEKWVDLPSSVQHLTTDTFNSVLESKETPHVLVAFHVRCEYCTSLSSWEIPSFYDYPRLYFYMELPRVLMKSATSFSLSVWTYFPPCSKID